MLAIVNPAAGGGRCRKQVDEILGRLGGVTTIERAETTHPGHATELAREGYRAGERQFLAVGGDGTGFEVVNGLMPAEERVAVGFLPLGTGNSFLRDFSDRGVDHSVEAISSGARRSCDVLRLETKSGVIWSINYVSLGLPADVGAVVNRRFKWLGRAGYVLGVLACLLRLPRAVFPLRTDDEETQERDPCLFLGFSNSKYTGGKMLIAPHADTADGLIEFVRMGPIGRLALLRNFPRLFDGSYVELKEAARRKVRRVEFEIDAPMDVMIDGEVLSLQPQRLEIVPGALDVIA